MTTRFKTGLVVGKFCPLHRGHQRLIDHAQGRSDELIIISYTQPEFARCEPIRREHWLDALYPQTTRLVIDDDRLGALCHERDLPLRNLPHNDAPDADHREFVGWLLSEILRRNVDAVFTNEDYGGGFAAALSAHFTRIDAAQPHVEHVCFDLARSSVPISGTRLRENPHQHREYLDPIVYSDFIERVAILGGESSGKTTLAQKLAREIGTHWAPEYGRELWGTRDGKLVAGDMLHIAQTQIARESSLIPLCNRWLICDTTPLTTLFYSQALFGHAEPALKALATRHYNHVFLCAPDFDFIQDGTRRDAVFRMRQHEWYVAELRNRKIAFTVLSGRIDDRIAAAIECMNR